MILDWIGAQLLHWLPIHIGGNPYTRFGKWCLRRAGSWAYAYCDWPHCDWCGDCSRDRKGCRR